MSNDHELPASLDEALTLAEELLEQGQEQEAFDLYGRIAKRYPDDPVALFHRGIILDGWDRKDEAITALQSAISRCPSCVAASLSLAGLLFESGDAFGAMVSIRDALTFDPDEAMHERLLVLKDMIQQDALERLLIQLSQAEAGYLNENTLKQIGRGLGVLLAQHVDSCKPDPSAQQAFLLSAGGKLYRAVAVEGAELVLFDSVGKQLQRWPLFPHASAQVKLAQAADDAAAAQAVSQAEFHFERSEAGPRLFLEYLAMLCRFLGTSPDKLYYVLSNTGRKWLDPVEFEPQAWKFVVDKLRDAKHWEMSGLIKSRDYLVEATASSKTGASLFVRSSPDRLEKLRELHGQLLRERR